MTIRFKKIKYRAGKKVVLQYQKMNKAGGWDDYSMECSDDPAPGFINALQDLDLYVEQVCELPEEDRLRNSYEVTGVSFSYGGEDETMGATITVLRQLHNSNSPLVLNTPHLISEAYSDGGDETQVMSADLLMAIHQLIHHARRYLDGHRAQMSLFQEEQKEDGVVFYDGEVLA